MHPEVMIACLAAKAAILEAVLSLWVQGNLCLGLPPCPYPLPLASVQVPAGTTHQAVAIHRVTRVGMTIAVAARAGTQVGPAGHSGETGVTALTGQARIANRASMGTGPRQWLQEL